MDVTHKTVSHFSKSNSQSPIARNALIREHRRSWRGQSQDFVPTDYVTTFDKVTLQSSRILFLPPEVCMNPVLVAFFWWTNALINYCPCPVPSNCGGRDWKGRVGAASVMLGGEEGGRGGGGMMRQTLWLPWHSALCVLRAVRALSTIDWLGTRRQTTDASVVSASGKITHSQIGN